MCIKRVIFLIFLGSLLCNSAAAPDCARESKEDALDFAFWPPEEVSNLTLSIRLALREESLCAVLHAVVMYFLSAHGWESARSREENASVFLKHICKKDTWVNCEREIDELLRLCDSASGITPFCRAVRDRSILLRGHLDGKSSEIDTANLPVRTPPHAAIQDSKEVIDAPTEHLQCPKEDFLSVVLSYGVHHNDLQHPKCSNSEDCLLQSLASKILHSTLLQSLSNASSGYLDNVDAIPLNMGVQIGYLPIHEERIATTMETAEENHHVPLSSSTDSPIEILDILPDEQVTTFDKVFGPHATAKSLNDSDSILQSILSASFFGFQTSFFGSSSYFLVPGFVDHLSLESDGKTAKSLESHYLEDWSHCSDMDAFVSPHPSGYTCMPLFSPKSTDLLISYLEETSNVDHNGDYWLSELFWNYVRSTNDRLNKFGIPIEEEACADTTMVYQHWCINKNFPDAFTGPDPNLYDTLVYPPSSLYTSAPVDVVSGNKNTSYAVSGLARLWPWYKGDMLDMYGSLHCSSSLLLRTWESILVKSFARMGCELPRRHDDDLTHEPKKREAHEDLGLPNVMKCGAMQHTIASFLLAVGDELSNVVAPAAVATSYPVLMSLRPEVGDAGSSGAETSGSHEPILDLKINYPLYPLFLLDAIVPIKSPAAIAGPDTGDKISSQKKSHHEFFEWKSTQSLISLTEDVRSLLEDQYLAEVLHSKDKLLDPSEYYPIHVSEKIQSSEVGISIHTSNDPTFLSDSLFMVRASDGESEHAVDRLRNVLANELITYAYDVDNFSHAVSDFPPYEGNDTRPSYNLPFGFFVTLNEVKVAHLRHTRLLALQKLQDLGVSIAPDLLRSEDRVKGDDLRLLRREAARDALDHAIRPYTLFSMGYDVFRPLTFDSEDDHCGNIGVTLIDALDTILLAGNAEVYKIVRDWIQYTFPQKLSMGGSGISLFECTIRVLGGLLALYDLSLDHMFLSRAEMFGRALVETGAFSTRSGIPLGTLQLYPRSIVYVDLSNTTLSEVLDQPRDTQFLSFLHFHDGKLQGSPSRQGGNSADSRDSYVSPGSPVLFAPQNYEVYAQDAREYADELYLNIEEDYEGVGVERFGIHGKAYNPLWSRGSSSTSEVGTLQVEFSSLSARLYQQMFFQHLTESTLRNVTEDGFVNKSRGAIEQWAKSLCNTSGLPRKSTADEGLTSCTKIVLSNALEIEKVNRLFYRGSEHLNNDSLIDIDDLDRSESYPSYRNVSYVVEGPSHAHADSTSKWFTEGNRIYPYHTYTQKIFEALLMHSAKWDGLYPIFVNAMSPIAKFEGRITLGARGDSFYEYLLKVWKLSRGWEFEEHRSTLLTRVFMTFHEWDIYKAAVVVVNDTLNTYSPDCWDCPCGWNDHTHELGASLKTPSSIETLPIIQEYLSTSTDQEFDSIKWKVANFFNFAPESLSKSRLCEAASAKLLSEEGLLSVLLKTEARVAKLLRYLGMKKKYIDRIISSGISSQDHLLHTANGRNILVRKIQQANDRIEDALKLDPTLLIRSVFDPSAYVRDIYRAVLRDKICSSNNSSAVCAADEVEGVSSHQSTRKEMLKMWESHWVEKTSERGKSGDFLSFVEPRNPIWIAEAYNSATIGIMDYLLQWAPAHRSSGKKQNRGNSAADSSPCEQDGDVGACSFDDIEELDIHPMRSEKESSKRASKSSTTLQRNLENEVEHESLHAPVSQLVDMLHKQQNVHKVKSPFSFPKTSVSKPSYPFPPLNRAMSGQQRVVERQDNLGDPKEERESTFENERRLSNPGRSHIDDVLDKHRTRWLGVNDHRFEAGGRQHTPIKSSGLVAELSQLYTRLFSFSGFIWDQLSYLMMVYIKPIDIGNQLYKYLPRETACVMKLYNDAMTIWKRVDITVPSFPRLDYLLDTAMKATLQIPAQLSRFSRSYKAGLSMTFIRSPNVTQEALSSSSFFSVYVPMSKDNDHRKVSRGPSLYDVSFSWSDIPEDESCNVTTNQDMLATMRDKFTLPNYDNDIRIPWSMDKEVEVDDGLLYLSIYSNPSKLASRHRRNIPIHVDTRNETAYAEWLQGIFSTYRLYNSTDAPNLVPEMDHLACFYPGNLALALSNGLGHPILLNEYLSTLRKSRIRHSIINYFAYKNVSHVELEDVDSPHPFRFSFPDAHNLVSLGKRDSIDTVDFNSSSLTLLHWLKSLKPSKSVAKGRWFSYVKKLQNHIYQQVSSTSELLDIDQAFMIIEDSHQQREVGENDSLIGTNVYRFVRRLLVRLHRMRLEYLQAIHVLEKYTEACASIYSEPTRAAMLPMSEGEYFFSSLSPSLDFVSQHHTQMFDTSKLAPLSSIPFQFLTNPKQIVSRLLATIHGLTRTCAGMYSQSSTGLHPEIVTFYTGDAANLKRKTAHRQGKPEGSNLKNMAANHDAQHSLLRPETVETLYMLAELYPKLHALEIETSRHGFPWPHKSKREKLERLIRPVSFSWLQDLGWRIFTAIQQQSRVASGGYSSLYKTVGNPLNLTRLSFGEANLRNRQESFTLAETFKYLYLLFELDREYDRSTTRSNVTTSTCTYISLLGNGFSNDATRALPSCTPELSATNDPLKSFFSNWVQLGTKVLEHNLRSSPLYSTLADLESYDSESRSAQSLNYGHSGPRSVYSDSFDSLLSLNKVVYNTEAHPLLIMHSPPHWWGYENELLWVISPDEEL